MGKASIIQKTDFRKNHMMYYQTNKALFIVYVFMQKARGVVTSLSKFSKFRAWKAIHILSKIMCFYKCGM